MSAQDPGAPPTPQEWLVPSGEPYSPNPYAAPEQNAASAMFELRPLNLSEILDRTFSLYRSRFWLFAGIAAFSGAVQAVAAAFQMLFQGKFLQQAQSHTANMALTGVATVLVSVIGMLLFFLAYSVTSAATAFAVGETYLGRRMTVQDSFRATIGRWYLYIGIAIWQTCSMLWVPMLLFVSAIALIAMKVTAFAVIGGILMVVAVGGIAVGYILYLRNSFGVPAAVTERLKLRAAMRRSKVLAAGTKGRIFVLHLVAFALYMVVAVVQSPLAFIAQWSLKTNGTQSYGLQAIVLIIGFVGHTVVSPVAMIGLVLLYIDQRVRKEAFDIAVMLGDEQAVETGAPPVEVTPEAIAQSAEQTNGSEAHPGDAPLV